MSTRSATIPSSVIDPESCVWAREIIRQEAGALSRMADQLDHDFSSCVELFLASAGHIVVTGIGKAGLIGQKLSATLASTGTPSYFLHPAEALHGDLGRLRPGDLVLALSYSGETEELVHLARYLHLMAVPLVAMTGKRRSRLGLAARLVLCLGETEEADPLGLAPTTSTTMMLALGDALALVTARRRGFTREDFARNHPGGSLGLELARVDDLMRPLRDCRVASIEAKARQVLVDSRHPGRRTGAVMLVDAEGKLAGIFTDSDLARIFEERREGVLDAPISEVMTPTPLSVRSGSRFQQALSLMRDHKISELPVIDSAGRPLGLIDITDIVQWMPSSGGPIDCRPGAEVPCESEPVTLPLPSARKRPGVHHEARTTLPRD